MNTTPQQFIISEKYKRLAELHITQTMIDPGFYQRMCDAEYRAFADLLPRGQIRRVLELGCGLGRMSIYLNWQLADPAVHYILADATEIADKRKFGWNPGREFYNDLSLTTQFCNDHGLTNMETLDVRTQSVAALELVDIAMSFLSIGFHYPLELYWDALMKIVKPDGWLLFGMRKQYYNVAKFEKMFRTVKVIPGTLRGPDNVVTREDMVCLNGRTGAPCTL